MMDIFITDDELVRRYRSGDKDAFNIILKRHHNHVWDFFVRTFRKIDVAEDLYQETFLSLFRRLEDPKTPEYESLEELIKKIVRDLTKDRFRWQGRQKKGEAKLARLPIGHTHASDADFNGEELRGEVRKAAAGLSPPLRMPATLFFIDECNYAEVAQRLGISRRKAYDQIKRARKALASKVAPHWKGRNHDRRRGRSVCGPARKTAAEGASVPGGEGVEQAPGGTPPEEA